MHATAAPLRGRRGAATRAGSITQDIYVILANQPGLLLGVYMTFSAYGFASPQVGVGGRNDPAGLRHAAQQTGTRDPDCPPRPTQVRDTMLKAVLFFALLISVTSWSIALFIPEHPQRVTAA